MQSVLRLGSALRHGHALAVLVTAGALVHLQCLWVGYLGDDYGLAISAASPSYALSDAFPIGRGTYFRPLVMATLRAERWAAGGDGPLVHHVVNLLLHIANACVLYLVCATLFRRRARALVAALVFVAHPVVVPDVHWISGRTDSLCSLFCLVTLLCAARSFESERPVWTFAGALACVLALASKETGSALLPLVIALWGLESGRAQAESRTTPPIARRTAVAIAAIVVAWVSMLAFRFYRTVPAAVPHATARTLAQGILGAPLAVAFPSSTTTIRRIATDHPAWPIVGLIVAASIAFVAARRLSRLGRPVRRQVAALGALTLAPVLPLLVTGILPRTRLMYLPWAVACIAAVGLVELAPSIARRVALLVAIALPPLAAISVFHGRRWVANTARTAAYCESFKALRDDVPAPASASARPVFIDIPYELDDVPLYGSHFKGALSYCVTGRLRYALDPYAVLPTVLLGAPETPQVSVERSSRDRFFARTTSSETFFLFDGIVLSPGVPVDLGAVTLRASEISGRREVRGVEVTLADEVLEGADLFWFDGLRFLRVGPAPDP